MTWGLPCVQCFGGKGKSIRVGKVESKLPSRIHTARTSRHRVVSSPSLFSSLSLSLSHTHITRLRSA